MKNLLNFIDRWGNRIIFPLFIVVFFKTCTTNHRMDNMSKKINEKIDNELIKKIELLPQESLSKEEMVTIIKETPAWKSLRLEEISDKERISINALEAKDEKEKQ